MKLKTRVRKPNQEELEVLEIHLLQHMDPEERGYMGPGTHEEFVTAVRSQPIAVVEYNDTGFKDVRRTTMMVRLNFVHLDITWENGELRWVTEYYGPRTSACPCARRTTLNVGLGSGHRPTNH